MINNCSQIHDSVKFGGFRMFKFVRNTARLETYYDVCLRGKPFFLSISFIVERL